jgi:hypothetical protein
MQTKDFSEVHDRHFLIAGKPRRKREGEIKMTVIEGYREYRGVAVIARTGGRLDRTVGMVRRGS